MPSDGTPRSNWGGKRPGAGAPIGNTNAFKTGKHSPRFRALARAVSQIPQLRDMAFAHYRLQKRKERQAEKIIQQQLIIALLEDPTRFNQILQGLNQLQHLPLHPVGNTPPFQTQSNPSENNQHQSHPFGGSLPPQTGEGTEPALSVPK